MKTIRKKEKRTIKNFKTLKVNQLLQIRGGENGAPGLKDVVL